MTRNPQPVGFANPGEARQTLMEHGYFPSMALATALFLTIRLERPLFLEGEPGVGKTEFAKVIAAALGRPLLRLQCYEGLDRQTALYEWNYQKQLLHIRVAEAAHGTGGGSHTRETLEQELFSSEFLLRRPLLSAVDHDGIPPILLIDEVDRADEAFEAFLLELLGEFQVTIPELGRTVVATEKPLVILTSNRTREVHDALKRRCLYQWIDYPDFDRELEILLARVPQISAAVARLAVATVQRLREEPLFKRPGVAETVHWAEALVALGATSLDVSVVEQTLGCLLKYKDDFDFLTQKRGESASRMSDVLYEASRK